MGWFHPQILLQSLKFIENRQEIGLLIANVRRPINRSAGVPLSGINVALLGRSDVPDLGVILISVRPQDVWNKDATAALERLGPDSVTILDKPFSAAKLLKLVRDSIGQRGGAEGQQTDVTAASVSGTGWSHAQ